jgi:hypothetical protein
MILKFLDFLFELNTQTSLVKNVLSNKKLEHSKRVAELTKQLVKNKDLYDGALYHDYLENGGKLSDLENLISPYSVSLVKDLTNDKSESKDTDNLVLTKLKTKLNQINTQDLLIIKLCDRCDNLNKRILSGEISKQYLKKSTELIQWIYDNYIDKELLLDFIYNNINLIIIKK